jgi:integrase
VRQTDWLPVAVYFVFGAAMPTVKLTSGFVRAATCPEGKRKIEFFDLKQRGFLLEMRISGGKTFYQRYTDARGRTRQFKIGPANVITLVQARRKATEIVAQALLGSDPQKQKQELRSVPTLNAFVGDRYLPYITTYKRSWQTDEIMLRVRVLPELGRFGLDEISAEHISVLIAAMRESAYAVGTINRAVVILRYIFNLARKWKIPGIISNPASGLSAGPDVQRSRFLDRQEIDRLIAAALADENRTAAQAILLLLFTGARRNEITQAKWEYLDFDNRTLLVPISKSGKPRLIFLNGHALAVLKHVQRQADNPYLFPSSVNGRPSPSLFFPWDRIRRRADLPDVRLHDLRHTFASILVNDRMDLYTVQKLLGHASPRATQRYAHLAPGTLIDATEAVARAVPFDLEKLALWGDGKLK